MCGTSSSPKIAWNGHSSSAPGSRFDPVGEGFHTPIGVLDAAKEQTRSHGTIQVAGTRNLAWVPVGKMNRVTLTSLAAPEFWREFFPRVARDRGERLHRALGGLASGEQEREPVDERPRPQ